MISTFFVNRYWRMSDGTGSRRISIGILRKCVDLHFVLVMEGGCMRQVYCVLGHRHFEDEECPRCVMADDPVAVWENPDIHTETAISSTGAYDPLIQEARDHWAKRIGREAAIELNPECDALHERRV